METILRTPKCCSRQPTSSCDMRRDKRSYCVWYMTFPIYKHYINFDHSQAYETHVKYSLDLKSNITALWAYLIKKKNVSVRKYQDTCSFSSVVCTLVSSALCKWCYHKTQPGPKHYNTYIMRDRCEIFGMYVISCQIANISHTKSQSLNVLASHCSCLSPIPLTPGVKSRMKMQLEQRRQAMLQLYLSDQQFYCLILKLWW